jgi:ATP-dependent DNA helicase Rep
MAQIENLSLYEATRCARFNEFFPDTAGNRIRKFSDWLFEFEKKFISYEPEKIIQKLLDDISFDDWLDTIAPDEKQRERKKNNIRELLSWIKKISEKNPGYELIDVVSSLMLFDVLDRRENEGKAGSVSLTTLHAAKGLEFPHVYIAGFEEGILPHHASTDDASIEEERRIAYVGITRAMKTLTLTYCNTRKRYGQVEICEPSRFLDELPQSEIEWERNGSEQKSSQKTGLDTLEKLRSRLAHTAAPDLE